MLGWAGNVMAGDTNHARQWLGGSSLPVLQSTASETLSTHVQTLMQLYFERYWAWQMWNKNAIVPGESIFKIVWVIRINIKSWQTPDSFCKDRFGDSLGEGVALLRHFLVLFWGFFLMKELFFPHLSVLAQCQEKWISGWSNTAGLLYRCLDPKLVPASQSLSGICSTLHPLREWCYMQKMMPFSSCVLTHWRRKDCWSSHFSVQTFKPHTLLLKHTGSDPFLSHPCLCFISLLQQAAQLTGTAVTRSISQVTTLQAWADPLLKSTVNKQTQVSAPFKVTREALPRRANFNKEMHDLKGRTLEALNSFFFPLA